MQKGDEEVEFRRGKFYSQLGLTGGFKSRLLFLKLPPDLLRLKSLLGASSNNFKSGKGGGESDVLRATIWAVYLLASALIIGKSEDAVSLDTSFCSCLRHLIRRQKLTIMPKTRQKTIALYKITTNIRCSTNTVGTFSLLGPKP